jgi:protein transport protein SEC61 subunit beta
MKLYTEDMPGIQVGPSTVLILSLVYIGVVVALHIFSKIKA